MHCYKIAGQAFLLPYLNTNLAQFENDGDSCFENSTGSIWQLYLDDEDISFSQAKLYSGTKGWVGGAVRQVEAWSTLSGILLRVSDGSDFYIASDGQAILRIDEFSQQDEGGDKPPSSLSSLEREIILGPALVLALALNETWSLHASAAVFTGLSIAFLGESGQGKSTLAAYLGSQNWLRLTDDILPVRETENGMDALPHFPQLKLPADAQPVFNFPEQLPLDKLVLLREADVDDTPAISLLPPTQAIQVLLGHTAGTRLFTPELLEKHLHFSAHVAERVPVYQLTYPHDKKKLPFVKELLEEICSA